MSNGTTRTARRARTLNLDIAFLLRAWLVAAANHYAARPVIGSRHSAEHVSQEHQGTLSSHSYLFRDRAWLVFRSYAAAACQAARTSLVCPGVGCAPGPLEIRAAIRVRRSWVSMSSKAGSVLAWYQGWAWRRAAGPARWWPCRAYQMM